MLLAESTRLLSFWNWKCCINWDAVETIAEAWMRYPSSTTGVIRCFSCGANPTLIQIESFLCQASPRFPIIFNAWMVQFRIVWRTLTRCLRLGHLEVQRSTSSIWSLSLHWVCTGKENYFDQQFQSTTLCFESIEWDFTDLNFSNCLLVPSYWYYQNNHLLVIPRLSEEVLDYLQLFVNNSQYVADSVDWSVILGF